MARYHLNEQGEPGSCRAVKRGCPFGGEEVHYSSPEEARGAYEQEMRRESLLQKGSQTLKATGSISTPLRKALRRELMRVEELEAPTSKEKKHGQALEKLLKDSEATKSANNTGPKRVGNVQLETQRDFAGTYIAVTDLSGKPLGTITAKDGSYIAATEERKNLAVTESRAEAVSAFESLMRE